MKDSLKDTFANHQLDWHEPAEGHMERFEDRLDEWSTGLPKKRSPYRYIAAAASILLLIGLLGKNIVETGGMDLKEVSHEMSETQDYFSMIITERTEALDSYQNPEEKVIIDEVLTEMKTLDQEYKDLKIELKNSSGDVRVIHAMIGNFQHRIALLETVLSKLKRNQELKLQNHENFHA